MTQETITEIDMDVFSRRMSPYLSWLESKIESGWEQSESVTKDVLKEVKQLSTTMRARFILGVGKSDFSAEVKRIVDVFSLAEEAFPDYSEEIEGKTRHFMKGIGTELGEEFLPKESLSVISEPVIESKPEPVVPVIEKIEKIKPIKVKSDVVKKIKSKEPKVKKDVKVKPKVVKKSDVKKVDVKDVTPKVDVKSDKSKTEVKPEPVKVEPKKVDKPKNRKPNFIVRWVKGLIFGDD